MNWQSRSEDREEILKNISLVFGTFEINRPLITPTTVQCYSAVAFSLDSNSLYDAHAGSFDCVMVKEDAELPYRNELVPFYPWPFPLECLEEVCGQDRLRPSSHKLEDSHSRLRHQSGKHKYELKLCYILTPVDVMSMSIHLFIHKKKSCQHSFFDLIRFEIFPKTCTYFHLPYTHHYKPRLVYFLPHFSLWFTL